MEESYYPGEEPQDNPEQLSEEEKQQIAYYVHSRREYIESEGNMNRLNFILYLIQVKGLLDEWGVADQEMTIPYEVLHPSPLAKAGDPTALQEHIKRLQKKKKD